MLRNNSSTGGHRAKSFAGTQEYVDKVAKPTMEAIDRMPLPWREKVQHYGYVSVYLAWTRGWSLEDVTRKAEQNGGWFEIDARR